jgi:hypothetical protein
MYHVTSSACIVQSRFGVPAAILLTLLRLMLWLQAWEVLDPPSGWDVSGPVLATGYYHVSATVLQLVMMMDDALAHACHQGEQLLQQCAASNPETSLLLAGVRACCLLCTVLGISSLVDAAEEQPICASAAASVCAMSALPIVHCMLTAAVVQCMLLQVTRPWHRPL